MEEEFEGELKEIDPNRIIDQKKFDDLDNFFLALGLIFNDLKGVVLFEKMLVERFRKPKTSEVSVQRGEYGGLLIQIVKISSALISEFFKLLEENRDIINSFRFKKILKDVNISEREMWSDIIKIVFGENLKKSDFSEKLIRVRNNITFHYYQSPRNLRNGFIDFFFKRDVKQCNNKAYYSIKKNMTMGNTRFYYVDAAEQGCLNIIFGDYDGHRKEVSGVISEMNFAIAALIKEYIRTRPYKN